MVCVENEEGTLMGWSGQVAVIFPYHIELHIVDIKTIIIQYTNMLILANNLKFSLYIVIIKFNCYKYLTLHFVQFNLNGKYYHAYPCVSVELENKGLCYVE